MHSPLANDTAKDASPGPMNVLLAQPRGFCAGVIRAIEIVERALKLHGKPVYVYHEIVHNRHVVQTLSRKGAIFVEDLDLIPADSVTIFSAHGVARSIRTQAKLRRLHVIDATCPLVTKVHSQAQHYHEAGMELIIIGHRGHPEVIGTQGQVTGAVHVLSTVAEVEALEIQDPGRVAYVTQTTLSIDDTRLVIAALERRFPGIRGPALSDICYATQNRQNAVRAMAAQVDVLLVVGARNSSNSNRLREVAEHSGTVSFRISCADDIDPTWIAGAKTVGVTAGASAPEILVQQVVSRLRKAGATLVTEADGTPESTVFPLPQAVRLDQSV